MQPGLIAGGGVIPMLLIDKWISDGYKPAIIAIDGFAEQELSRYPDCSFIPLGSAGQMIDFLKDRQVTDLVITGKVVRPDFLKLKPDARGMMFIAKIMLKKKIGDNVLLTTIRKEIEKYGFKIRAVQEFLPDLLTPAGLLTKTPVIDQDKASIDLGYRAALDHGLKDLGQAVVVQNESVIGFESEKGTNALIREAGKNKQAGRGPILVKTCKPQQDKSLDLPTIGISTAREVAAAGFAGIVVQAHETLFVDREETIEFCDQNNIFIYGLAS